MSGGKTITYLNFLRGIPATIVALGGMIKKFSFYPSTCVTLQKIQPSCAPKLYILCNIETHPQQKKHANHGRRLPQPLSLSVAVFGRFRRNAPTHYIMGSALLARFLFFREGG